MEKPQHPEALHFHPKEKTIMGIQRATLCRRFAGLLLTGMAGLALTAFADEVKVTLSGESEVPPVHTMASGSGSFTINPDKTVTGAITTTGVAGTMAHIHLAAKGVNGPVIVPLAKNGDSGWTVPAGSKLTDAQYQAYKSGELYVNVHSDAHKGGEIRAQLEAPMAMAPGHKMGY